MRRTLDVTRRFPALYRHDLLEWQRERLGLSRSEVGRKSGIKTSRINDVFAGTVTSKQLWRVANALGLDWAALHNLKLKESEFHLAVINGARSG